MHITVSACLLNGLCAFHWSEMELETDDPRFIKSILLHPLGFTLTTSSSRSRGVHRVSWNLAQPHNVSLGKRHSLAASPKRFISAVWARSVWTTWFRNLARFGNLCLLPGPASSRQWAPRPH
jgi:hypothetical protein